MALYGPDQALEEIINLVGERFKPYLILNTTSFKDVVEAYPNAKPATQAQANELAAIRTAILSGNDLTQAKKNIEDYVPDGPGGQAAYGKISTIIDAVRYVEAGADPMGRGEPTPSPAPAAAGMAEEMRAGRTTPEDAQAIIQSYIERGLSAEEARREFERTLGQQPAAEEEGEEPTGQPSAEVDTGVDTGVPEDFEAAAAQIYGGYYAIVKQNKEIADLLLLATQEGWDESKFKYQLEQTNWWKDTTGAAREFAIREQRDPATVATEINNKAAELQAFGVQVGLTAGSVDYNQIARDALRFGWGDQVTQNALNYRATQSVAGRYSLLNGYYGDKVRDLMRDYGQSLPNETLQVYVNDLATGAQSLETLKLEAEEAAKAMFPGIADRIGRGQTVAQIAQPYRNTAAAILEVDPNSIDFTKSEWAKAFTVQNNDGSQRTMNFNEWGDYLRTNRQFGYEYTTQAKQRAYQVANQLADLFGKA